MHNDNLYEKCSEHRWAICGIMSGVTLVVVALTPLWIVLNKEDETDNTCETTTYTAKYGVTGFWLSKCNDSISKCSTDIEAAATWIKCSFTDINLPIVKQSNIDWRDFVTISNGAYLFYKYGKCLEQTNSSIALPNDITCSQDSSTMFPCVPYVRNNCPSTSSINEFSEINGYNLTALRHPSLISVYKNVCEGDHSDNLCINASTEINCNGVCSPCSSDLVASFLPINGSSEFDLC